MVARVVERRPAEEVAPAVGAWLAVRRVLATGWTTVEAIGRGRLEKNPHERAQILSRATARLLDAHGIEITVSGAPEPGPAILVANHLGYLDPLVITSLWPCAPIAKSEFGKWPLLGSSARGLGVLFVRRGDVLNSARVLRSAGRLLERGLPILNFPEGTTSFGNAVARFRRGIFGLARIAGVPVIPIALRFPVELCWAGDDYFLPHYLRTAARAKARISVQLGKPMSPDGFDDAETMAEETRRRIHRMLRRA